MQLAITGMQLLLYTIYANMIYRFAYQVIIPLKFTGFYFRPEW